MAIRNDHVPSKSALEQRRRLEVEARRGVEKVEKVEKVEPVDGAAATHLAEGMARQKVEVAPDVAAETKHQLEELRIAGKQGKAFSKREFTPEFQAAKEVGRKLLDAQAAALDDKAPEWKAAVDAVAPEVSGMVQKTAAELVRDPAALGRVKNVVAKVGTEAFTQAVKDAAPDVAKAFTAATGAEMVNKPVVEGALKAMVATAEKVAPDVAADVAKRCASLGAKVGVDVASAAGKAAGKEVAEGAAKAVATSVAKAAGKEVAEGAAKVGAKGAAAAGKAVPVVGNVIAVGSTCLAAISFVKALFNKPPDVEKSCKEGVNTLLQAAGIAFPWAALGGDVLDLGWSAKLAVRDAKQGASEGEKPVTMKDAAGVIDAPARALASALDGAGQGSVAQAFRDLAQAARDVEQADTPSSRAALRKKQAGAFELFAKTVSAESSRVAATAPAGGQRDALENLSHGFGRLFQALYQQKKLGPDDVVKRDDVKAKLIGVVGDVAKASAALAVG